MPLNSVTMSESSRQGKYPVTLYSKWNLSNFVIVGIWVYECFERIYIWYVRANIKKRRCNGFNICHSIIVILWMYSTYFSVSVVAPNEIQAAQKVGSKESVI